MVCSWQSVLMLAVEKNALRRVVFSKPLGEKPGKAVGRLCKNGKNILLALEETLGEGKVRHRNFPIDGLWDEIDGLGDGYGQINIITSVGDAEYRQNKKGSSVLLGGEKIFRALDGKNFSEALTETLDRRKDYILNGDEPFLIALGIADKNGRIHDKKQAKFRQINRFLEHVRTVEKDLPAEGVLRIYDLCCGKSYLSFAVYHYFTAVSKREVEMLCMDLKRDVMEDCACIASSIGYGGMRFVAGDVRNAPVSPAPHLMLSLHACDIATDIVLHLAVKMEARVVLSTPCCHHSLAKDLDTPSLSFATQYPHLKGKLCEVLTDAARLARLRAHGYEVAALELTDPDDTPKNTLLRARRVSLKESEREEALREYREILCFLLGKNVQDYPEVLS